MTVIVLIFDFKEEYLVPKVRWSTPFGASLQIASKVKDFDLLEWSTVICE